MAIWLFKSWALKVIMKDSQLWNVQSNMKFWKYQARWFSFQKRTNRLWIEKGLPQENKPNRVFNKFSHSQACVDE